RGAGRRGRRRAEGPAARGGGERRAAAPPPRGAEKGGPPLDSPRRDFLALYGAGADVLLSTYPCTHMVHPNMLRDINRWVIRNVDHDTCWEAEEDEEDEEEN